MGDVDILVNNAGAAWGAPAEDHPVEAWDKLMNLNVRGYFILSPARRQAQHDSRASPGRIINIASIAGLGGNPPEMTDAGLQHLQGRGDQLHPRRWAANGASTTSR